MWQEYTGSRLIPEDWVRPCQVPRGQDGDRHAVERVNGSCLGTEGQGGECATPLIIIEIGCRMLSKVRCGRSMQHCVGTVHILVRRRKGKILAVHACTISSVWWVRIMSYEMLSLSGVQISRAN